MNEAKLRRADHQEARGQMYPIHPSIWGEDHLRVLELVRRAGFKEGYISVLGGHLETIALARGMAIGVFGEESILYDLAREKMIKLVVEEQQGTAWILARGKRLLRQHAKHQAVKPDSDFNCDDFTDEGLGRLVRETWIAWACQQEDIEKHPNWCIPWELLPQRDKEVDIKIALALEARLL